MEYDGLYIKKNPDGTMTKRVIFGGSQRKLPATTIKDEIISFSEQNFEPYLEMLTEIDSAAAEVIGSEEYKPEVDVDEFMKFANIVSEECKRLQKKDFVMGTLTSTLLKDSVPVDDGTSYYIFEAVHEMRACLYDIYMFYKHLMEFLHRSADGINLNFKRDFKQFTEVTAPTRCMFDGKNLTYEYVFRSLSQYYIFIVQQFIAAGYRAQRCNCCGRYFVPKTKKETLYCDRVIRGGRTCKDIGPSIKRKHAEENDEVIKAYRQNERKLQRRKERARNPIMETNEELAAEKILNKWRKKAQPALAKYQLDEITKEEALSIIITENKKKYDLNANK